MVILNVKARPYDFSYNPSNTALVLNDFQRDFLLPGGFGEALGNDVSLLQATIEPTRRVLEECRKHGILVVHTREGHLPDLSDCPQSKITRGNLEMKIGDQGPMGRILIRGEYGHGIIDELAPIEGELLIDKPGKDPFYNTDLDKQLKIRNITHMISGGVTTEVCEFGFVRGANDRGYEVLVLEDCVASYNPDLHDAALKMIVSQGGIFGWVTNSKEFLRSFGK